MVISDQFEQRIFLVKFPYASSSACEEEEEEDIDAFEVLSQRAKGLNRSK